MLFVLAGVAAERNACAQMAHVQATGETDPIPSLGDSADDPAIWLHPTDLGLSVVLGTDKRAGMGVYNLDGSEIQFIAEGWMNNVDVRYNFPLSGRNVDLVVTSCRTPESIVIYTIDPQTRTLENISARTIPVGVSEAYGLCLYRSPWTLRFYAFVVDREGHLEQWRLFDNGEGKVDAVVVRAFDVGSRSEGMVADDELGCLYLAEETVAIWKYGAEPDACTARVLVDDAATGGHLVPDIEGLTLYTAGNRTGYLIAASQGDSSFVVYRRDGANEFVMKFNIVGGDGVDGVNLTDGIDVANIPLGPLFPKGLLVVHDHDNTPFRQNFKLVPWEAVAAAAEPPLIIDTNLNCPIAGTGDCTSDELVRLDDFCSFVECFTGPRSCSQMGMGPQCTCADFDCDADVDLRDLAFLQNVVVPTVNGDLDGDGQFDLTDLSVFTTCMGGPSGIMAPPGCTLGQFGRADQDGDEDVDLSDFNAFLAVFGQR
ncbi:MAG: phytase [Phycisphaerae bacterium]|nr:phytase [Phycisphaerae bacterium]